MKTSIATVCLAGDFREELAAVAAAGFDGIEIFEQDFLTNPEGPRVVGQMVRDHGLEITLFQPFRDFEGLPEPQRDAALRRAARKFEVMNELGTDLMLVCSSVHQQALGGIDRMAGDFRRLGDLAAEHGVRVGFEALAWGRHVSDHRDAWEVVRRAGHPQVGLILDSFHTLARGIAPDSIRAIPADRIFFVQLADAPAIEMDLLYLSRHFRSMPGEGELDVTGFMRAVQATGYAGPVSLEVFNDLFRGGSPQVIARDGQRSLVNLMDKVRRTEPGVAVDLPEFPPPQKPATVAYVEFASQATDAGDLGRQLRALGFGPVARHHAKQVTIWQQGDIRLLINTEPQGFAAATYNARGQSVCEVGVTVADADAAAARAIALGETVHDDAVPKGDLQVPAFRGVGGTVLRFLDPGPRLGGVWTQEFEALDGPGDGAGLMRIDHIAQIMPYDEMLSWTLFYTSLLDMAATPMVDVADPHGLVRSLAVESPGRKVRLTLNGAESHRTLAGAFLSDSFGSSVQHVALATDDILATAGTLAANGFAPLPIPGNYYDDLAARLDLTAKVVASLQAGNLLYDRDAGGGEFFQLYSRPMPNGFFFEIVERRGGYAGYGAANAPFRIAAQKRLLRAPGMPRA